MTGRTPVVVLAFGLALLATVNGCAKLKEEWKAATQDQAMADDQPAVGGRLDFKLVAYDHGKPVIKLPLATLQRRVNGSQPRVNDPLQQANVVYEGVATEDVLDSVFGTAWRSSTTVAVRTSSGLPVLIPASRVKEHRSFLVWRRMDRPDFVIERKVPRPQTMAAGPLYLVWENIQDEDSRREGALGWVPGVVALDLVDVRADSEALQLPPDAPADAAAGAKLFRSHCLQCHTVNGVGNPVGPELNYPTSVTEYIAKPWLLKFIGEPTAVRYGTMMPGMPSDVPDRPKALEQVVAYLTYMAAHKQAPMHSLADQATAQDAPAGDPVTP